MPTLKFNTVKKDQLFYNSWHYVTHYHVPEAHVLRELDHKSVDLRLDWIADRTSGRKFRWNGNMLGQLAPEPPRVTTEIRQNLHDLVTVLTELTQPHKLIVSSHSFSIYTNSLEVFDSLETQLAVTVIKRCEATIDRSQGTILLTDPQHTHRSYFSLTQLTTDQKKTLVRFLQNQTQIRPSPSLAAWCTSRYSRLQDYYFIDHNGAADLTMLNLVQPGLIRKTMQILPR